MDNKEYAIVAMDDATAFVDISTPTSPRRLGYLPSHTGSSYWRDVKVYSNHAYIVSDDNGNHGMQIFDLTRLRGLSTNASRTFTADGRETWTGTDEAHNIVINEDSGYAYVVGTPNGMQVFDLNSSLTSPNQVVSNYNTYGYCHDAQVVTYNGPDTEHNGKEILIGSFSGSDFVYILDVSNKASISLIGQIDYTGKQYTHQGWFTEDMRFFITGDELDEQNAGYNTRTLVFDMQDLDNPTLHYTHTASFPAIDHNGYVKGNRFYLANYRAGMRVFKIDGLYDGTPSMTEVGYFDTYTPNNNTGFDGLWNVYPFFESGNIIASGFGAVGTNGDGGLFILKDPNFDNTDPTPNCQNFTATLDAATGSVTIDVDDIDNGSTDDFGITSRTLSGQTTFTCADVGQTFNVTLNLEDDYGNTASCVAQVTVEAAPTSWNGTNWSAGAPQMGSNAIIASGTYDTGSQPSIDACECEVNNGATLNLDAGTYLKTEQDIRVDTGGTLVVQHQASVVQEDDNATVTNDGTINVNLTTPNLGSRDFMILGSPMDGESRGDVWNSAFLVLDHTTANFVPNPDVATLMPGAENFADDNYDNWNPYIGALTVGEGYIVRPQAGYGQPGGIFNYTYDSGTLNNGVVNFDVVYNQPTGGATPAEDKNASPNVVSNPYASAISANAFITANDMVDEIYFWEHITPPSAGIPGAGSMDFSMEDISMRNLVGGVAATNDLVTVDGPGYNEYIATGQGFAFKANLEAVLLNGGNINDDVVFDNSMRVTGNNDNLRNPVDKDRIWIAIGNSEYNVQRSALIGFMEGATPGMDRGYDTRRLATMLSIYSHLDDGSGQLGIQGREPFESGMKVELGFSSLIDVNTEYKISIRDIQGPNLEGVTVFLKDKLNPGYGLHNLSLEPYAFQSEAGTFHNRFVIQFYQEPVLNTDDALELNISMFPNPAQERVNIYSPTANIQSIEIYDLLGKRMESQLEEPATSAMLDLNTIESGMYFVRIQTDSGSLTKKLLKH